MKDLTPPWGGGVSTRLLAVVRALAAFLGSEQGREHFEEPAGFFGLASRVVAGTAFFAVLAVRAAAATTAATSRGVLATRDVQLDGRFGGRTGAVAARVFGKGEERVRLAIVGTRGCATLGNQVATRAGMGL